MQLPSMSLNTTAGLQYETYDWNSVFVHATGMIPTQTNVDNASSQSVYHDKENDKIGVSFYRVSLTMNENLYLAASVRGDVSSTMGDTEAKNGIQKWLVLIS